MQYSLHINGTTILGFLQALLDTLKGDIASIVPNIQELPFFAPYVTMTEAAHYYTTIPQPYSQKREIVYPRGNMLGMIHSFKQYRNANNYHIHII
jgi:hypothetical protein